MCRYPAAIAAASDEALRACGLSAQKIRYLRGIAAASPDWAALRAMPDDEVLESAPVDVEEPPVEVEEPPVEEPMTSTAGLTAGALRGAGARGVAAAVEVEFGYQFFQLRTVGLGKEAAGAEPLGVGAGQGGIGGIALQQTLPSGAVLNMR